MDKQVIAANNENKSCASGDAVRVGVFCVDSANSGSIDLKGIAKYAGTLPEVALTCVLAATPVPLSEVLAKEIRAAKLNAIVIAAEHPGFVKPAFARALTLAGLDPQQLRLASFGQRSGITTDRAKAMVVCAVNGMNYDLVAEEEATPYNAATLIIGAGIAGIQASLEIAESGNPIFLVERTGTIGGRMAMFDKTFPTLDCAACILTPKMVAVGQNPNIKLMVLSEVQEITGVPGAYKVKVLKRASRVDASACVACGDCARVCPTTTASDFDMGISTRKSIYIPFPQAVPNTFMIDANACTWIQSGGKKCGACAKKCSKDAIHLDAQDEIVELEVGNIIVSTGYQPMDPKQINRYGYGTFPNVLTALEFERLTNASGPTGGKIVLKSKKQNKKTKTDEWIFDLENPKPKSVAILHCVGSRDQNHNAYCSRVCCMYSLKFAHLVREKLPDAKCYEFYIDMRAFGKGYEEFFNRIHEEGVSLVRGRTQSVLERDNQLYVRGENIATGQLEETPVDMVILSIGLQPSLGSAELAGKLGIGCSSDGWMQELDYNAASSLTNQSGIYVAGFCQGPKDIPDTVAQASAAAGSVMRAIVKGQGQKGRIALNLPEIEKKARALANSDRGRG